MSGSKSTSGFVPSVLSLGKVAEASNSGASATIGQQDLERYLIISPEDKAKGLSQRRKPNHKPGRTKNRKAVSLAETISHNGKEYKINNSPAHGIYRKILNQSLVQLDICLEKWRRVFVIRFDLRQRFPIASNAMVSRFHKNLRRRLERHYDIFEIGYLWVREQETSKAQHYHIVLFLDGNKIQHPKTLLAMVDEAWKGIKVGNNIGYAKNCFYKLSNADEETKQEVIQRISYLAKQRGKGYRKSQVKDYSTSRLTKPFSLPE